MVMRGIRPDARIQLVNLNSTRTLDTEPVFRLDRAAAGAELWVRAAATRPAASFSRPKLRDVAQASRQRRLAAGTPYTWEVSTRLPDGRKYSSSAEFAVAAADLRAEARRAASRRIRAAVDPDRVCRVARPDGTQGRSAQILEGRGGGAPRGCAAQGTCRAMTGTPGGAMTQKSIAAEPYEFEFDPGDGAADHRHAARLRGAGRLRRSAGQRRHAAAGDHRAEQARARRGAQHRHAGDPHARGAPPRSRRLPADQARARPRHDAHRRSRADGTHPGARRARPRHRARALSAGRASW